MKHQLNVMNRWRSQQKHLNELGYPIGVGKQFNQNLLQLQLKMMIIIKLKLGVIIKN